MKTILIVIMVYSGEATTSFTQEFDNMYACEAAGNVINDRMETRFREVVTFCMEYQ